MSALRKYDCQGCQARDCGGGGQAQDCVGDGARSGLWGSGKLLVTGLSVFKFWVACGRRVPVIGRDEAISIRFYTRSVSLPSWIIF